MLNVYDFIFKRLIWKMISVYFLWFHYWILKEWKLQKCRIILPQHANYFHKIHFLTCLLLPCLLNMCKPRTTLFLLWRAGPPGLAFYGSGIVCLLCWLGMVNAGWLGSIQSEIFLQMKFIIFQGCPTKQAAFLPRLPTP